MNNLSNTLSRACPFIAITCAALLLGASSAAIAGSLNALVDDFSHNNNNSFGLPRQFLNDTMVGGSTLANVEMNNGIMHLKGEIVPPRGQPGWASTVLLLDKAGMPVDLSNYEGIRMRVKINSGSLSISANSTEVTNFDYHSSVVMLASDGQFHDVKIPFDSLKRGWSAQTKLNTKSINALSIVAFSLQKAAFDYEIDEVRFY